MEARGSSFSTLLKALSSRRGLLPLHFLLLVSQSGWERPDAEIEVLVQIAQLALVIGG